MRTALQRMRHRPKRWIALWAAFALLFNQISLAQHLCLYTVGEMNAAMLVVAAGDSGADCHSTRAPQSALTTDAAECAVHCDDGDKQTRDLPSLKVPDLFAASSEVAILRSTDLRPDAAAIAELPRPAHARRTTDFSVLLI